MMCLDSAFAKNAIVHFRELKKCSFVCLLSFFLLEESANSRSHFYFKRSIAIEIGLEFSTNLLKNLVHIWNRDGCLQRKNSLSFVNKFQ